MTQTADELRAAKALIDTPDKWLKGRIYNDNQSCFCALGALYFAGRANGESLVQYVTIKIINPIGDTQLRKLAAYNDHPDTTHADIMALFDRAIAAAEAGE